MIRPTLSLLAALVLAAPAAAQTKPVSVDLKNAAGQAIGTAMLTEGPKGVLMRVEVKGLQPGWHGIHFHEVGDCSKSDFTSAGGHVHGEATHVHGLLNPANNEAGDLPNLHVDASGVGAGEFFSPTVTLAGAGGRLPLLDKDGSAIVIHASPDDQTTQPIGGAGARVACGVVK